MSENSSIVPNLNFDKERTYPVSEVLSSQIINSLYPFEYLHLSGLRRYVFDNVPNQRLKMLFDIYERSLRLRYGVEEFHKMYANDSTELRIILNKAINEKF